MPNWLMGECSCWVRLRPRLMHRSTMSFGSCGGDGLAAHRSYPNSRISGAGRKTSGPSAMARQAPCPQMKRSHAQKSSTPIAQSGVADHEPQGLEVGMSVTVSPDVNGGEQPVAGNLRFANAETVVIERAAEDVGTVCVHFPRSGYRVDIA